MKKFIYITTSVSALLLLMVSSVLAQGGEENTKKRAQTGMKFLSVSLDARAAGMSNAVTAVDYSSSVTMFYNPASMAYLTSNANAALGITQWLVDINYTWGSIAFRPGQGRYGVFGLHLLVVDYGDITETIRANNVQGYQDVGQFSPSALVVGLGYAKALSDKFSFGVNGKYVREDLGVSAIGFNTDGSVNRQDNKQNTFAFDIGFLYRTGFRSLTFAMVARNFSGDQRYQEESFELPLTFRIGVAMDLLDLTGADKETHSFLLSIDTERPRDFSENIRFGGEYTFKKFLALRVGYVTPMDEESISFGAGFLGNLGNVGLQVDYAYTDFGVFDNINRFSVQFSF